MNYTHDLFLTGYVGYYLFSTEFIKSVLDEHKDSEVNILMSSTGGSTFDGMAIAGLLRAHGSVNIHMIGVCASAATIAAMGAKKISMDSAGLYLVHNCKAWVDTFKYMNSEEIAQYIKSLEKVKEDNDKIDIAVASMYAQRCKKSQKELMDLMSKDCLLTAQEALEWGLVDEVTSLEEDKICDQVASIVSSALVGKGAENKLERGMPGFMKLVSSFFGKKPNTTKNTHQMKEYPSLSELGFDTASLVSMDKEKQFDGAEEVAKGLVSQISDLKAQVKSLSDQVASLSKQPAEKSTSVVSSGAENTHEVKSYADVCKGAQEMLNFLS